MKTIAVPIHIAIIPDGNRRWAKAHKHQILWRGHAEGAKRFEEVLRAAFSSGVRYLTMWTASIDNLKKRPAEEIAFLVNLFTDELNRLVVSKEILERKVRVRVLGKGSAIVHDAKLDQAINRIEKETASHTNHHLTILFGYDGQQEMLEAVKQIAKSHAYRQAGKEQSVNISGEMLQKHLETGELPLVDLVIRTGGEPHWSAGFMMWHTANSQFYFTEKFWPEFDTNEFQKALEDFLRRERRLGK